MAGTDLYLIGRFYSFDKVEAHLDRNRHRGRYRGSGMPELYQIVDSKSIDYQIYFYA